MCYGGVVLKSCAQRGAVVEGGTRANYSRGTHDVEAGKVQMGSVSTSCPWICVYHAQKPWKGRISCHSVFGEIGNVYFVLMPFQYLVLLCFSVLAPC